MTIKNAACHNQKRRKERLKTTENVSGDTDNKNNPYKQEVNKMEVLTILFISAALAIGIFCVVVVCRDMAEEARQRREGAKADATAKEFCQAEAPPAPTPPPAPVVALAVVEEETETTAAADTEQSLSEEQESNVAFSAGSQTLEEKYLELSPEFKGYYDEIVRYAMSVENSRRFKNAGYEEYKVGKNRLVRLKIRRGLIVCELVIPNLTFKNYISDNKVAVKQAPAVIKVTDEAALSAVKDSIDIAVSAIEEEKIYKKEQAKIKRKQRREAAALAKEQQQQQPQQTE